MTDFMFSPLLDGDLAVAGGDLAVDDGFVQGVVNSLFIDGRLPDGAPLPEGEAWRRGWWGDALASEPTGSLLWTLGREVAGNETLSRARGIIGVALAWMPRSKVAPFRDVLAVEVPVCRWGMRGRMDADLSFFMRGGQTRELAFSYGFADRSYVIRGGF